MTDENMQADAEGVEWGPAATQEAGASWSPEDYPGTKTPSVHYPEYGPLPEAPISINFRPGDKPQITVRAAHGAQLNALLEDLESNGCMANLAAFMGVVNVHGALGGGLGPVSPVGPPAPPQGYQQGPQGPNTPPPFGANVSVPGAPNYQGPPQGGYQQGPPPQQGGWGGGQQRQGAQEKPRPAGWAMVDVPFNDKDRFKALRQQGTDTGNYLRGKIQWGGKGVYWLDPSVAAWIAQQGFPVTQ